jgi:hypothetical protein
MNESPSIDPVDPRYPSFSLLFSQFTKTVEALVELIDTISPHVAELDDGKLQVSLPRPPEGKTELLFEAMRNIPPEEDDDSDDPALDQKGRRLTPFGRRLAEIYGDDPEVLQKVDEAFRTAAVRPRRDQLLHGSLLVMAFGALETTIAGIGAQHFLLHPAAMPGEEKEFSLADLAAFERIQDARELAITRRVDGLVRGGLESWNAWLGQLLKVDLREVASEYETLVEVIQRRHVVVHNAGLVSRQYLANVEGVSAEPGDKLVVDRPYLEIAIREIAIFGARLLLLAWSKWLPGESDLAAQKANDLVFQELVAGRFEIAHCIAKTARGIAEEDQIRWFLQVNGWLAVRGADGVDAIKDEVEAWDVSALSPLYVAAKAALLDDFDTLFEHLPPLVEHGEIGKKHLEEWPLFNYSRTDPRWAQVLKAAYEAADDSP